MTKNEIYGGNKLDQPNEAAMNASTIIPNPYSSPSNILFQLETVNYFRLSNPIDNSFFNDNECVYNGVAGGLFEPKHEENLHLLLFKASTMKTVRILVAIQKSGYYELIFELTASDRGVFCLKLEEGQFFRGAVPPANYAKNTSLVMCVKSDLDNKFEMTVKMFGSKYGDIHWHAESGLIMSNSMNQHNEIEGLTSSQYRRCCECLVISLDVHGHLPPCAPLNTISHLRTNTYSRKMTRLIQLRFDNPRNKIQVLNNEIGNFVDLNEHTMFNNDVIEGIFTCKVLSSRI